MSSEFCPATAVDCGFRISDISQITVSLPDEPPDQGLPTEHAGFSCIFGRTMRSYGFLGICLQFVGPSRRFHRDDPVPQNAVAAPTWAGINSAEKIGLFQRGVLTTGWQRPAKRARHMASSFSPILKVLDAFGFGGAVVASDGAVQCVNAAGVHALRIILPTAKTIGEHTAAAEFSRPARCSCARPDVPESD